MSNPRPRHPPQRGPDGPARAEPLHQVLRPRPDQEAIQRLPDEPGNARSEHREPRLGGSAVQPRRAEEPARLEQRLNDRLPPPPPEPELGAALPRRPLLRRRLYRRRKARLRGGWHGGFRDDQRFPAGRAVLWTCALGRKRLATARTTDEHGAF